MLQSAAEPLREEAKTKAKGKAEKSSLSAKKTVGTEAKSLANAFRRWGYLNADLDALGRITKTLHTELKSEIAAHDKNLVQRFNEIYCGKLGLEFMYMSHSERCEWLAQKMETEQSNALDPRYVLKRILEAETLEKFIHTRYVGTKRFSLDGLCALIPLLDVILDQAAQDGVEIVMLGMSHRGRINVLHHIGGASLDKIFARFEDIDPRSALGGDDVKYHLGSTGVYRTISGKELYIDISFNPSHLEAINPVVMGRVRARQERLLDTMGKRVLGILIHGEAAFAGQGVTAEALNFMNLPGFRIGGMIHILVNNLVGFTTVPEALNSTRFAADIAKRLEIPIFHVNAESPEHVVRAGKIAAEYRQEFASDALIDLIGYRRYGHNEADDPTYTSPKIYAQINKRPLLCESYARQIGLDEEDLQQLEKSALTLMEEGLELGRSHTKKPDMVSTPDYWTGYLGGPYSSAFEVPTNVSAENLELVTAALTQYPKDFNIHSKLPRLLEQRLSMGQGKKPIDWGMAEALAFGTLLLEDIPVRLTGQDVRRGTFSHRHAVFYDQQTETPHIPLRHIAKNQARFDCYDSHLSEAGVVGFEYGFTRDYPEALVCWEAQFGDFVNGAQILIDQFISAGEDKWQSLSGVVMLLPHGYEGAGPEHSHARLERFLQLSAEDNIQVCYPSTAAQYFHMLRRQALRRWRKPLVVMTPKSMLRAAAASSPRDEFINGSFRCVIDDSPEDLQAERVLVCSGKIVHELRAERAKRSDTRTAIISLEQLYPLPELDLAKALANYPQASSIIYVQEEPANMGALFYIKPHLERLANGVKVSKVSRSASASPATGSPKAHALEQEAILNLAFARYE